MMKLIERRLGPASALFYAVKETWFVTKASLGFCDCICSKEQETPLNLGGPIKIAKITGQVAKLGVVAFLSIMAYISISLRFYKSFSNPNA